MNDMSGYILWIGAKAQIPIRIAHSHIAYPKTDNLRQFVWWFGRKLISRSSNTVLGCSSDAIIYLTGLEPDNLKRIILKNAIDIKKFAFNEKIRTQVRSNFNADQETLIIGNVARFDEQKNHQFILKIFQEVLSRNDNAMLILIGNGSLFVRIKEEAGKLGIESKISFLGIRNDVHKLLNAMDVFLLPSQFEGLGIVLVEAQANGLPCVASDTIPAEVDMNAGLMTFFSLNANAKSWSKIILKANRSEFTNDPQISAKEAGYDIHEVATWLQEFYSKKTNFNHVVPR